MKDNSRCLQIVLAINDPELALGELRPICLSGRCVRPGHDKLCLLIPLHIVHEIFDMPIDTCILASHDDPLVGRFLTLKSNPP